MSFISDPKRAELAARMADQHKRLTMAVHQVNQAFLRLQELRAELMQDAAFTAADIAELDDLARGWRGEFASIVPADPVGEQVPNLERPNMLPSPSDLIAKQRGKTNE